ncbi:hypothetical protein D3C72_1284100 [compost metagenome]
MQFDARQITYLGGVGDGFRCSRAGFAQARAFTVVDITLQVVSAIDSSDLCDLCQLISPIPQQPLSGLQLQQIAPGIERLINGRLSWVNLNAAITQRCHSHAQGIAHRAMVDALQ